MLSSLASQLKDQKGIPVAINPENGRAPSRRSQSAIGLARSLAVLFSLGSRRAGKAGAGENRQRGNQRKHVPHGNCLDRHRGERGVDNEDHEENDPQSLPAPDGLESENEEGREKQGSGGASERSLLLHPRQRHFNQDLRRRVNRMLRTAQRPIGTEKAQSRSERVTSFLARSSGSKAMTAADGSTMT